jgi:hypothetical protein
MLAIDNLISQFENSKIAGSWLTLSIKTDTTKKNKRLENYMLKYGSYSKNKYLEL